MRALIPVYLALGVVGLTNAQEAKTKEDLQASVIGKWVSDDDERVPLEFLKDGTARVGFVKEKDTWLIATGKYTVSEKGRVECEARHGGVTLKEFWTLKDGVLTGGGGPNPMVKWVKVKEDKEKKE